MSKALNWKLFFIILIITLISLVLGLPYIASIQGDQITSSIFTRYILIYGFISVFSIIFGLKFGRSINLDVPIIRSFVENKKIPQDKVKYLLKYAPLLGLLFGGIVYSIDLLFAPFLKEFSQSVFESGYQFIWWKGLLAAFYGGIFEEILMRFFALTFYAWVISWIYAKIKKEKVKENKTIIWTAIIISALLFGIGHLPALMTITTLTPLLIFRTVLLNALPGLFFGWLFYKKGLESAMVSHFFADISLHLLIPLFFM